MTPKLDVKIHYRSVPRDLFEELEKIEGSEVQILIEKDETDQFNFNGPPSEIIIYFSDNWKEFIVGGLFFDAFKFVVKSIWTNLAKYYSQTPKEAYSVKSISLNLKIEQNKSIECYLEGALSPELVSEITDKLLATIKDTDTLERNFKNKQLHDIYEENPKLSYYYDKDARLWLPINFEERKRDMDNLMREAMENLDS